MPDAPAPHGGDHDRERGQDAGRRRGGFINATDCADYLVAEKGLPFRDAYKITGELVALCIQKGLTLETLPLEEYQAICPAFDEGVYQAISLEKCVGGRKVLGGARLPKT